MSVIDSTISQEQRQEFVTWQEYDDSEENFCDLHAGSPQDLSYVDLLLNPERYTGYSGHSTERIWRAIYHENCFRPEERHPSAPLFDSSQVQGMCLEKRAFYRLISGMHASINIHLSALYIASGKETSNPKFHPNMNEFVRRFDAATTNGQGPSWLKNLYFAYLLVLRAVEKAGPYWGSHAFFTGDAVEDLQVQNTVREIVQAAKSCSNLFDETMLFNGNTSQLLKNDFKAHFKNISRIMDCVGCSKCRLWGKLQIQGIGTALKILFSGRKNGWSLRLTRREIIALFNVVGRFSNSIHSLEMFREMQTSKDDSGRESRGDSSPTLRTRSEL